MKTKKLVFKAKVSKKGRVTVPKALRDLLGVGSGGRVTFVLDNETVLLFNSFKFALTKLQDAMEGEAEKVGLDSDEAIVEMIKKMRRVEKF